MWSLQGETVQSKLYSEACIYHLTGILPSGESRRSRGPRVGGAQEAEPSTQPDAFNADGSSRKPGGTPSAFQIST